MVKEWLIEEEILKAEVPDENAVWHYVVEFPKNSKQMCEIIKPIGKDYILVVSVIVLSENHYKALKSLPYKKRREIIHKWKMDLLFRNVEFRMIPDADDLQRIEFTGIIYDEEITKPKLMNLLREVFKCKLYIIWNAKYELESGDEDYMYL